MSQRQPSQENYGSVRGHARTDRFRGEQPHGDDILRGQRTERQLHEDSPTRHDVEFYVRKVNRYQAELARLEHDLSVTKFRLSRAEDAQIKYDILFKEHQKTQQELTKTYYEKNNIQKNLDFAGTQQQRLQQQVRSLKNELSIQRKNNEQLRNREQAKRVESTSQNHGEKQALRQAHNREIQTVKNQGRERSNTLQRQLNELNTALQLKEATQSSLNAKLDHIKKGKNQQIARLQQLTSALRLQLGSTHVLNEETALNKRSEVISQTQHRLSSVRNLTQLIQDTLAEEISNLNATLTKKNQEIRFILECDAKQLRNHADSQNSLKLLISRLEDKIFTIQRENQLQLFQTIARLQAQYQQNLQQSQAQWQNSRIAHNSVVDSLRKENQSLKRQVQLMGSENLALQRKCKLLGEQQQHSVQMLSQKILGMEAERDKALQNYTTSMKQIEDDAKTKLDDLHSAVTNKNGQNQILVAQLNLKNGQITHLLQELSRLRDLNRQKIKKLENTNASEQNALNKQITDYKNYIFQLKRNLHEVENTLSDFEAESKLQKQMIRQELQAQKQANQLLKSRNKFLAQWTYELERDLKAERVSNVNILHDQNISQRQNVQVRQEVRVQLEVLKQKEIEQQKNIHKLEKNRLQSQLAHREHELRDKKEQLSRLLVQYKALESKVGKSSKVDRSAEDSAKCRATIQAEILLTQNIFNAINRP